MAVFRMARSPLFFKFARCPTCSLSRHLEVFRPGQLSIEPILSVVEEPHLATHLPSFPHRTPRLKVPLLRNSFPLVIVLPMLVLPCWGINKPQHTRRTSPQQEYTCSDQDNRNKDADYPRDQHGKSPPAGHITLTEALDSRSLNFVHLADAIRASTFCFLRTTAPLMEQRSELFANA